MKTEKEYRMMKAGIGLALIFGIAGIVTIANMDIDDSVKIETMETWNDIDGWWNLAGEANPGAGASGILEIFFINHSADKYYTQENTTATLEAHCTNNGFGWVNADNQELDIAHTATFDILVKVRGNATHCKHGATWFDSDLNVTMTWSDKGLTNDQPDGNTTYPLAAMNTSAFTYLYVIFYWDNGGAGYSINKGQTTNCGDFIFAYYG